MRRKLALTMAAVATLTLGIGVAHGVTSGNPAPREPVTAVNPDAVTLPTGDRVRLGPDGAATFLPAKGRESVRYFSPQLSGESQDRIVIPDDAFDEVESGKWDARLFNIDALLRTGFDDARDVADASILGEDPLFGATSAGAEGKASTTAELSVKLIARDGGVPDRGIVTFSHLTNPENSGIVLVSDGTATIDLEPGRYGFVFGIKSELEDGSMEVTGAVSDITVGSRPVSKTVDARRGNQVSFSVDRPDAVQQPGELDLTTYLYDSTKAAGQNFGFIPGDKIYGIPSKARGHQAGMILRTQFINPDHTPAGQRYSYSLVEPVLNGIPRDLSFHYTDEELAEIDVNYQGFAAPGRGYRSSYGFYRDSGTFMNGGTGFLDVPGARTEYYTAHPEVYWEHSLYMTKDPADDGPYLWIQRRGGTYEQGSQALDFHKTGGSMAVDEAILSVSPRGSYFQFYVAPFSAGPADQIIEMGPVVGSASASFNGKVLYDGDIIGYGILLGGEEGLPEVPAEDGRYTITISGAPHEGVAWLHPGSEFESEWAFDVEYADGWTNFNVGAVRFDSKGIVDSRAEAGSTIDVELTYAAQPSAVAPACTSMTFEVSYDDGQTWQAVQIARDGNRATATLTHPTDAEYVSLRFTAEDEAGNSVKHTTIRSYALH